MTIERIETAPQNANGKNETDIAEQAFDKKMSASPAADAFEEIVTEQVAPVSVEELLQQLNIPREPDEKVDVHQERKSTKEKLEKVETAIKTETEKSASLETVRESLGIGHEGSGGGTIEKLKEAREKLENEQRQIELADEYNDVLASFPGLSPDELKSIRETGKTAKGKLLRNATGHEIHSDIAKELAHLYASGGQHITWGTLNKLYAIADRLIEDALYPLKRFLHLGSSS